MTPERIEELLHLFHEAPIARYFGMTLSYTEEGNAVVDLPYNPDLDHGGGGIHGGVYAAMLDSAGLLCQITTDIVYLARDFTSVGKEPCIQCSQLRRRERRWHQVLHPLWSQNRPKNRR